MEKGSKISLGPGSYTHRVSEMLRLFEEQKFVQRLWNREESTWIRESESKPDNEVLLGWLDVVPKMLKELSTIRDFVRTAKNEGFTHAVVLGMGGSSLAPMVFSKTFQPGDEGMKLTVLDSTNPVTIAKAEQEMDLASTLFIVSSKSGSTTEVNALFNYFYYKVANVKSDKPGDNFVAITDEGTSLAKLASEKKFRETFINFPHIGGRFSALSYFGIVPAMLMGINVKELLKRAAATAEACRNTNVSENPGMVLGAAIGVLALEGKNKLTYFLPAELASMGAWMEQLLAESTGKHGSGILPVCGHDLPDNAVIGSDSFFVQVESGGPRVPATKTAGNIGGPFPVIRLYTSDPLDLGAQFFLWEIATAAAGYILGLNPFDQPDVQASKKCTTVLLNEIKKDGKLTLPGYILTGDTVSFCTKDDAVGTPESLLTSFFAPAKFGDYVTILAYLPEEDNVERSLCEISSNLRNHLHLPVTCEFGPRYLHSTGQFHKGGPEGGIFLQLISDPVKDIHIPGEDYTFGTLIRAQAIGDMQALRDKGRAVLQVNLGTDVKKGLSFVNALLQKVMTGFHQSGIPEQNPGSSGFAVNAAIHRRASGWI